jgi:hypothetical protein
MYTVDIEEEPKMEFKSEAKYFILYFESFVHYTVISPLECCVSNMTFMNIIYIMNET